MDLLQQLDIVHPIFVAPMAGVSTPELAAVVSNAGGLGALGLGASSAQAAKTAIEKTRQLTQKPFQVNFFCHQPVEYNPQHAQQWIDYLSTQFAEFDAAPPQTLQKIYQSFAENDDLLDVVLETKPKAVSFHFGLPRPDQLTALKQAGILTMVSVTQLSEALAAQQAGIDILIAQGIEAGGHRGTFNPQCDAGLATLDLLLLLKQYIDLPIVAAGGIMTGEDIRLYRELGADAAQLGTAFVQCAESAANDAYRTALFEQPLTQISDSISGRAARGLFNAWHQYVDLPERPQHAGYPYSYDLGKQLHAAASKQGEQGFGAFWAGSNVANIRRLDAAALMQTLLDEMSE
ncbi:MAG: nitronate monooxygenase [Acinetobacter populi]|jgi:nitronate monooxygenase|uniref:NAD(P)H-dependent flavin oxidoreductase n=1 Tax=Acinetobacter populi TaxID=1582270 RepID=UPI0023547878|nr:nitronate monooxygenase [Acinetobacter populi]MCH4247659.1 nitronate monooxygenase [Acinetobacter populi]